MALANWATPVNIVVFLALAVASSALGARSSRGSKQPTTLRALYGLRAPTSLRAAQAALVLVDFQDEFVHGRLPLPDAGAAIARAVELAAWARRSGIRVVRVHNVVDRAGSALFTPGAPTTALVPELRPQPGDLVVQKGLAGAFSRTQLDAELRARGIDTLVIGGFMTHLAVFTTASDAMVLGYRVIVAADATATRTLPGAGGGEGDDQVVEAAALKRAALAALADRAADVMLARVVMALPVSP